MSNNHNLTNFESVGQFHEVFGHPKPSTLQKDILVNNPKLAQFRLDLIEEEVKELNKAVDENNMTEVIDALGDILYVVYGMGHAFGINLDNAFKIVHESNMSKLCNNETQAKETIEYYKTLSGFENVDVRYRLSTDGNYYVIYNAETGKILKSKYFKLPDFTNLMK